MDLILHIGLPKTGTTTIQWLVRDCPGYFARDSSKLKKICRTRQGENWYRAAQRWSRDLQHKFQHRGMPYETILLSSEAVFTTHPKAYRQKWPIFVRDLPHETINRLRQPSAADYLQAIQKVWPHGQVKVLLTLRNQPDWLASLYSQLSDRIKQASQADFEHEIRDLISRGDDYIDWSQKIDSIQNVVGADNLQVLLLEDIHRPSYWENFARFTGINDSIDPDQIASRHTEHKNARQVKSLTWRLRPLRHTTPNLNHAYIALRNLEGPSARLRVEGMLTQTYRGLIDSLFRLRVTKQARQAGEINMHPELGALIRDYCQPFNKRLADHLQRNDLAELGY